MPIPCLPDTNVMVRIRAEMAALRLRFAFERLRMKAGFNPNQPRVPAGNPDGGQWTAGEMGRGPSARLGRGRRSHTSATTSADGSLNTRIVRDRSGDKPWSSYAESHRRSDGKLVSRTVTNRDGSRIGAEPLSPRAERNTVTLKDGVRFTFENDGDTFRVIDSKGRLISEAVWTANGPKPQPIPTPAFIDSRSANDTLLAGAALFNWLSSLETPGLAAVAVFNATEFLSRDGRPRLQAEWLGQRADQEIDTLCKKSGLVKELAEGAAASSPQGLYRSAAARGTDIHVKVKKEVDKLANDDFRAELSILKAAEDRRAEVSNYGMRDSIRIDIFERLGDLVCVYDLKTGKRRLSGGRIHEIADNVYSVYPRTRRILVIEVRVK
ncbi:hypothetical protein FQ775_06895 [Nitratireductor mangrovi]|uniref:Uncharacterized protein n=1 Tax=Nitratireductor mangrovi TaxID=2599600 RepID=A0A5B8KX45_9HYPH|nr:hypothetical protein [Nitratireductor mangrovi]QDZ00129.1 hypothetical protein FQ775_06895 [Nitratireductor mangrovi]